MICKKLMSGTVVPLCEFDNNILALMRLGFEYGFVMAVGC
jgi:hypothetical protein